MERLVLFLCGMWFWLTRRGRSAPYKETATTLKDSWTYLWDEYNSRASTQDRGFMLPEQVEALNLLERKAREAQEMAERFETILGCYGIVADEMRQPELEAVPVFAEVVEPIRPAGVGYEFPAAIKSTAVRQAA